MISIDKWQGLISNASPYALPGGAFSEQVNIQCLKPGQVEVRRGYSAALVSGGGGARILTLARFQAGTAVRYIALNSDGRLTLVDIS